MSESQSDDLYAALSRVRSETTTSSRGRKRPSVTDQNIEESIDYVVPQKRSSTRPCIDNEIDNYGPNSTRMQGKGKLAFPKHGNYRGRKPGVMLPGRRQNSQYKGIPKKNANTSTRIECKPQPGHRISNYKQSNAMSDESWRKSYVSKKNKKKKFRRRELRPAQMPRDSFSESRLHENEGNQSFYSEMGSQSQNRHTESNSDDNQNQGGMKRCHLGYKRLENLAEQEPCEIVTVLANSKWGFVDFLKQQLKPDLLILTVKALSKVCTAEFEKSKVGILLQACHSDFLEQLSKHIALIHLESNKRRKDGLAAFVEDVFMFMETVMNLLPSMAADSFENIFKAMTMMLNFESGHDSTVNENLRKKYEQLHMQYKACVKEQHEKKVLDKAPNSTLLRTADVDFRDMSLFPTSTDVLGRGPKSIRSNIVPGAYDGVLDYLDIQFRLLREDFISPLREGISDFVSMTDKKRKINNVRIYRKAYFLKFQVTKKKLGLIVCFDPEKRLKRVVWEHAKRLMFGSLLIFSKNNFSSVVFATVMDRDMQQLKNGNIVVQLSTETELSQVVFNEEYVMVESEVYFEPYYHVLRALQHMPIDRFPMEKYIIHAKMSDAPPMYMCREGGVDLDIDGWRVSVLVDSSWPSPMELGLDVSQYSAFKSALTKEFVVIQGPPGTGKTFLGLKVAHVLLRNAPLWHFGTPLLVVCFTNHALDQFLEGLAEVTNQIVRIGGQSKSEVLQAFNLKERRKFTEKKKSLFDLENDIRNRMTNEMRIIQCIESDLEMISSHRGIISPYLLQRVGMQQQHMNCFTRDGPEETNDVFVKWLQYGMVDFALSQLEGDHKERVDCNENNSQAAELQDEEDIYKEQHHMQVDQMDFDLMFVSAQSSLNFALDLTELEMELNDRQKQKDLTQQLAQEDPNFLNRIEDIQNRCNELQMLIGYVRYQLSCNIVYDGREIDRLLQTTNLWELSYIDCWTLYKYWICLLKKGLWFELHRHEKLFRNEARMFEEVQHKNDLMILRNSLVVGITTTGAARLQTLLQALKSKIVIVEEAAEVLESHIVVSLTPQCEHLILIGDHQQLRPTTAVYRLARDHNLDISLFERMVKNNMHCDVLEVQHRMRPEIASLIVPTIYTKLENHATVLQFEKIRGVLSSLFFVTHNYPEEQLDDTASHQNPHEADFLIALCRHLVLQGYDPSRITVLTTYSGQMFYLRNARKNCSLLSDVKMTVVDNFQGEENDIILLSLVRSNQEARIGFLKTENRVCVALSRARKGFYIIGNMDNLTKSSTIWPKIKQTLTEQNAIGTHLTLRCEIHPSQFISVATADDFNQMPEGGCTKLCEDMLICGHRCKRICHIRNREHEGIRCLEPCNRVPNKCELSHACKKNCWEHCGDCKILVPRMLPCGHSKDMHCSMDPATYKCLVEIEAELSACKHKVMKPCHADVKSFPCSKPCKERLPCGHSCKRQCHTQDDPDHLEYQCNKPCTRNNALCKENHKCKKLCFEECGNCLVIKPTILPQCEHLTLLRCYIDPEKYKCHNKCTKTLQCGHPCPRICSETCGNCAVKVMKPIPDCGHIMVMKCCDDPHPTMCKNRCDRLLSCGHKCTTVCRSPCISDCKQLISSTVQPICGHSVSIPCCWRNKKELTPESIELLSLCKMPCGALLSCEHKCVGTCGECLQGRIHRACNEKCGKTLICGHSCNTPCAESCPPCDRSCAVWCKHSKCSLKCGEPCIPCKEPCGWACIHQRCTKLCHEPCDREPCSEPCSKLLPCKHPCIGFCGEPCPPLCRVCNNIEIFFGTEDDPDARFLYLEDCRHVLEATGMDQWMKLTEDAIKLKECPRCKTPIAKTQRYMNVVKMVNEDVNEIKKRCFGNLRKIEASQNDLKKRLNLLEKFQSVMTESSEFKLLYERLSKQLQSTHSRNTRSSRLSIMDTDMAGVRMEIFSQIVNCYAESHDSLHVEARMAIVTYMDKLLRAVRSREKKISSQEVGDLQLEIRRFHHLCQFYKLVSEPSYGANKHDSEVKKCYEDAYKHVYSIRKFTDSSDETLVKSLEEFARVLKSTMKITDVERREIVQAMGYKQGHWYKCPNNHIYIITECGRAMQEAKCPECKARIGGSDHRLLSDNRVATEMDGAAIPAWPQ